MPTMKKDVFESIKTKFDISATYYKGGDVCSDFLSVDIATQHGSLSQRIGCDLEALYILSDKKAEMQTKIDSNKHSMKRLAEEQSRLKRELSALDHLISSMIVQRP